MEVPSKTSPNGPDEPKRDGKQIVAVKFWVVEVEKSKLRNLGFDMSAFSDQTKPIDPAHFAALARNRLANVLATPKIMTLSGRKAAFELGPPQLKFEVTPTIIDAEHIAFDYHVDVATRSEAPPDKAGPRLISACSTELKAGAVQLLSETNTQQRTAEGEPSQITLLVLAQATIVK